MTHVVIVVNLDVVVVNGALEVILDAVVAIDVAEFASASCFWLDLGDHGTTFDPLFLLLKYAAIAIHLCMHVLHQMLLPTLVKGRQVVGLCLRGSQVGCGAPCACEKTVFREAYGQLFRHQVLV